MRLPTCTLRVPIFIIWYMHIRSYLNEFRSSCYIPESVYYFTSAFVVYLPLILIFFRNFHIFSVARKQRKRILAETTIVCVENSIEESANRVSFVLRFFVALKAAKTFAMHCRRSVDSLYLNAICGWALIMDKFCTISCKQVWFLVLHYELYGINSIGCKCIHLRNATCKLQKSLSTYSFQAIFLSQNHQLIMRSASMFGIDGTSCKPILYLRRIIYATVTHSTWIQYAYNIKFKNSRVYYVARGCCKY